MSELVKQSGEWMQPQNMGEAERFATVIAKSGLAPKAYANRPGDVLVAMAMGANLGLGPMQALQNIAVINGTPSLYGDAALAVCQAHPAWGGALEMTFGEAVALAKREGGARTVLEQAIVEFVASQKEIKTTDLSKPGHVCAVERAGEPVCVRFFDERRASEAKLLGKPGPWSQYPWRMYQMRARGFALRDSFADALKGMVLYEEAADYDAEGGAKKRPRRRRGYSASAVVDASIVSEPKELPAPPVIDDALARIASAESIADLEALLPEMSSLNETDIAKARVAYAAKSKEIKAQKKD